MALGVETGRNVRDASLCGIWDKSVTYHMSGSVVTMDAIGDKAQASSFT